MNVHLTKVGGWRSQDCCGCPDQSTQVVETSGGEKLTLYLRWRYDDPWEGYVIRHDLHHTPFGSSKAPWSPDLLEPFEHSGGGALFDFFKLGVVPAGGFPHEARERAKTALLTRAKWWFADHLDNWPQT